MKKLHCDKCRRTSPQCLCDCHPVAKAIRDKVEADQMRLEAIRG